ncbi:hypothetical protein QGM71_18315 [Virgibacillus sp. C22-A2]|uniref:Uncharacterized protein n=1 Tax=Virgibacillus tibetensis TaxID=3042313 RepID=A0ABU6KKN4_9BACI|nr:hypothetical protein [Virgibacillus sp. C22-A2]
MPPNTVDWILKKVDADVKMIEINKLKGSTSSTLHHNSIQIGGQIKDVVIRQFDNKEWLM